jgi:hypothetical protein
MKKLLLGVGKLNRPPKQTTSSCKNFFYTLIGIMVLLFSSNANAQTVAPYTTSTTWLCPAGVFSVQVECWGAGGGGGAATAADTSTSNRSGGGGGAGSYVKKTIAVVPGTTYTVTVGAGGIKGDTSIATGYFGGPGGKSEFSGPSITAITASGGTGGTGAGTSNITSNPGGVLGGLYGFTVSGTKINSYTTSSVVSLTGGGGSGVTTIFRTASSAISYIAATNQGTGYTTAPSVEVSIGSGQTFTALVNPNINSSGAETTILGSDGGASTASAGGAGGASPDGLGGFLAGGAGGTGTTVGAEYLGATPTNAGAGGGGGFSVYALSSNIPAPKSSKGGVGANGKIVLTYTATIPSITVTPATLSGFSTVPTAPSTAQTFSVSGSLLEADIVITVPTNYEINNPLVDGTYGSSITLTQASGSVAATTINVRLKTGLTGATAYLENISLTTTNGTTKTVACSGGVLAYYYYAGSGSLANVASWSTNTNGVGGAQPINFTTVYQVFVIRNTTAVSTTDVSWNVAGTGSVIQVGDPAVPGVALTIASGLDISTSAVDPVVGNGTIDIPAASSGVNSVILQSAVTPPAMGIMDANSEVHYRAAISTSTSKTFGKMFIENNSTVTFTGKPIVQTTLDVATGSTLLLGSGTGDYVVVNAGATVAIDGSLKSGKSAGIFSYGVTTPGTTFGSIQFKDAVGGLTLGSSSTVEYSRTGSSTAQPISTLPTGVKYNNLTLSDSGALNNKLFSGAVTVNNTFTLNQSLSNLTACGNLTLADGATIVRNGGSLDAAPVFGNTVNVSYNGATAITSGVELPTVTSVLNNLTVNNAAGVTLGSSRTVNGVLNLTAGTLTTGANTLTLGGTPTVTAGNINASNSGATVTFANPSAITLPASLFTGNVQNLTINGAGGVTLGTTTSLAGKLTVTSGVLNTANFLTLKSSDCCTASVGELAAGAVTGDVTVERYIPSKRAWRALTAPVSTTTSIFENWQENGTGNLLNGFDIWSQAGGAGLTAGGISTSVLEYDSITNNTWSGISATNTNNSMMNGDKNKPFMAFVTGPYGSNNITNGVAASTTLKATGSLFTGDQTYTTTAGKYSFIGNPYASPLSLSSMITSNNASFEGNIWIWDANTTVANPVGIYNLYNNGTYTNVTSTPVAPTTEIQSGQAFFVRSTGGDSFIIQESNKGITNSAASIVFRDAAPAQLLRVGLYKQVNNEWEGRDGAMTVLLPNVNTNQTPNKMANGTENIAFTKNGSSFASNHHLPLVASDVLNVKVWNTTAGANYKLKINTEQFNTTNLNATLEDVFTNSRTPLTLDGTAVEYPFAVTTEATSTGDRFRIVFENSTLGINNPKASGISILPNPITGDAFQVNLGTLSTGTYSYSISNALGQEVEKGSINNVAQNTSYTVKFKNSTANGMYIMKVTGSENSVFTAKIIKQ